MMFIKLKPFFFSALVILALAGLSTVSTAPVASPSGECDDAPQRRAEHIEACWL
ncbi:hypothetical protein OH77DRAFT_1425969 [Trametes cingulata]|nr:hypothetical protein OH77DRAFT_1425969 [Trametes cingulata]